MWQSGRSGPQRCYVLEAGGGWLAGVVYWRLGRAEHVEHLATAEQADPGWLGVLLRGSLRQLAAAGTERAWAELSCPPLDAGRRDWFIGHLKAAGFEGPFEEIRWEVMVGGDMPQPSGRLGFGPLPESASARCSLLANCCRGGLDPAFASATSPAKVAELLADMTDIPHRPDWWEQAFDEHGRPVGLVLPTGEAGRGAIGFAGVWPEHRGRRYVDDLLARGLDTLAAAGISHVHAHCAAVNVPMAAALARCGFREVARRWRLEINLPSGGAASVWTQPKSWRSVAA